MFASVKGYPKYEIIRRLETKGVDFGLLYYCTKSCQKY